MLFKSYVRLQFFMCDAVANPRLRFYVPKYSTGCHIVTTSNMGRYIYFNTVTALRVVVKMEQSQVTTAANYCDSCDADNIEARMVPRPRVGTVATSSASAT